MVITHSVVVAAIVSVTLTSPSMSTTASASIPPSNTASPPIVSLHRAMFRMSLSRFTMLADSPSRDLRLDWTSDGCSAPVVGSTGRTFDFTAACRRHDFGYRNYKTLDEGSWWTPTMRHRIDRVFRNDMFRDCSRRRGTARRMCRTWANTFYKMVRAYAGP